MLEKLKINRGNWKKVLGAAAVAVALLGVGILAGYAIGVSRQSYQPGSGSGSSIASTSTGNGVNDASKWRELPPPGSAAAKELARSDTTGWIAAVYTYHDDSNLITAEATRTFLLQLQQELQAITAPAAASGTASNQPQGGIEKLVEGQPPAAAAAAAAGRTRAAAGNSSSSNSSSSRDLDLTPFIRVAFDVLGYLRYHRSEALLLLLREFAQTGSLAVESVDPDVLRAEATHLLNATHLQHWYLATSRVDSLSKQQQGGRRLQGINLPPAYLRKLQLQQQQRQRQHQLRRMQHLSRRLHQASTSAVADPTSILLSQMTGNDAATAAAAASAGGTASTALPKQAFAEDKESLTEMLCSIRTFSPQGLQGVLPEGDAACPAAAAAAPPATVYSSEVAEFKPVKIPVVFHILRFRGEGDVLMPPNWGLEDMARNLIAESNKLYKDSGIQFTFREVRQSPQMYAYLIKRSLTAWQDCSYNLQHPSKALACLRKVASTDEVAELAEKFNVNVFVAGSQESVYCKPAGGSAVQDGGTYMRRLFHAAARKLQQADDSAPACSALALGETTAYGPWWDKASPTWAEDKSSENFIFMTWDQFNRATRNSARFWNGGACTLSHELGHFLGLLHPHQDAPSPCGSTDPDAVADTPINLRLDQYAASQNLLVDLAAWCADFRNGNAPPASQLARFNSCGKEGQVDNVFLIMAYVPDACCMLLTEIQKERLQWAIASYRPQFMQANVVK